MGRYGLAVARTLTASTVIRGGRCAGGSSVRRAKWLAARWSVGTACVPNSLPVPSPLSPDPPLYSPPPRAPVQRTTKSSKNTARTRVFVGYAVWYPINSVLTPGAQLSRSQKITVRMEVFVGQRIHWTTGGTTTRRGCCTRERQRPTTPSAGWGHMRRIFELCTPENSVPRKQLVDKTDGWVGMTGFGADKGTPLFHVVARFPLAQAQAKWLQSTDFHSDSARVRESTTEQGPRPWHCASVGCKNMGSPKPHSMTWNGPFLTCSAPVFLFLRGFVLISCDIRAREPLKVEEALVQRVRRRVRNRGNSLRDPLHRPPRIGVWVWGTHGR